MIISIINIMLDMHMHAQSTAHTLILMNTQVQIADND